MKNLKDIRYGLNIQRFPYGAAPYSDKHVPKQCCTWRDLPCCFQYSSGLGHQQWMLSLTVSPPRRTTLMRISHFCLKRRVVVHVLLGNWYPPKDPDFFTNSCLIWAWLDSIATTRTFNSDAYVSLRIDSIARDLPDPAVPYTPIFFSVALSPLTPWVRGIYTSPTTELSFTLPGRGWCCALVT